MMLLKKLMKKESGATAVEYGLIASLLSIVIIVAVTAVGSNLKTSFTNVASALKTL